jgi:DNA polymerase beta
MVDYKAKIIDELNIIRKSETVAGEKFKVIAYSKAINGLKDLPKIESIEDIKDVKGIGEGIRKKIAEIIETGELEANKNRKDDSIVHSFMNIYGVGRVKALKLANENNIQSIEDLRNNTHLLNTNQKIGLVHYEDFLERIPRKEMGQHSRLIKKAIKSLKLNIDMDIVGSYRRGEESSGDIDVLLKSSNPEDCLNVVNKLKELNYITDTLALGDKKFMGVCKIGEDNKYRRLDILYTPEEQYGYAILYFTGSMKFNIAVRKKALERGYSLNEHGFTPNDGVPLLKTEEEILNFLGIKMIDPKKRKDEKILLKNLLD